MTDSWSYDSIANQVLSSSKLAPIGDMQSLFMHMPHYTQCDEPGWQATIEGKIYEDKGHFAEARSYFWSSPKFAVNSHLFSPSS